jgi:hypothetical protein
MVVCAQRRVDERLVRHFCEEICRQAGQVIYPLNGHDGFISAVVDLLKQENRASRRLAAPVVASAA